MDVIAIDGGRPHAGHQEKLTLAGGKQLFQLQRFRAGQVGLELLQGERIGGVDPQGVAFQQAAFKDHRQAFVEPRGHVVLPPWIDAVPQIGVKRLVVEPHQRLAGALLEEAVDLLVGLPQFVALLFELFGEFRAFPCQTRA